MADAFPISGSIDPKAFPYLLMDLHRNGATGSLKVEGPSYQKALYFRSGRVLFGSSNDPRDQLGAILIETGKITPEQLEDVQSKVGPGNPLAKALAETGYVSQRELSDAARAKVESILSDVIAYTAGNFEFEDGVLPKGAIDLKLSTEKLVIASVRRLTDRNFVLRHLDGLEVVLAPGAELVSRFLELEPEAGGLPEKLDGQRTLKESAALTRLDEFEAAKIACALLFLGMVKRAAVAAPEEPVVHLADDPLFKFAGDDDDELDLGDTARASIGVLAAKAPESTVTAPVPAPEPAPMAAPAPIPIPMPEPEPEPEPVIEAEPAPSPLPPVPIAMAAAAAPDPRDVPAETPFFIPEDLPQTIIMAPPEEPAPAPERSAVPFHIDAEPADEPEPEPLPATVMMPPPAANTDSRPGPSGFEMDSGLSAGATMRPSKEDQAALDALLSAPAVPTSPAPAGRRAPRVDSWSAPPSRPAARRASTGPSPMILGGATVLLVAAAAGAAWYLWGRTPASAGTKSAAAQPPVASAPVAPVTVPPSTPRPMTATAPPAAPSLRATPMPPTPNAGGARTPPASLAEARALLKGGNFEQAAQGFAATVKAAPARSASVQILVACSPETVEKAVANAGSPELFIVPVNYQGRDCYRLMWGLYESEARAASAMPSLPEYFRKGARPRVVGAAEIVR